MPAPLVLFGLTLVSYLAYSSTLKVEASGTDDIMSQKIEAFLGKVIQYRRDNSQEPEN
jgi:hypothetical protein